MSNFMLQQANAQVKMEKYQEGIVALALAHGLEVQIVHGDVLLRAATPTQAHKFLEAQKIYAAEFTE